MSNRCCILAVAAVIILLIGAQCTWAIDGYWSTGAANPGNWSVANNWDGGIIADGIDAVAFFLLDIPAGGSTVNIDATTGQTIGKLYVGYDMDSTTAGGWLFQGNTLNIASSTGTGELAMENLGNGYSVEISAPISVVDGTNLIIAGTSGGTLKLSGSTTVVNGNATIQSSSIVNLSGNMALNNGNTTVNSSTLNLTGTLSTGNTVDTTLGKTNIYGGSTVNLSGSATLTSNNVLYNGGSFDVGLTPTDAATVTLNRGLQAGWATDVATINVRGSSTISTTGTISNEVQLGPWGSGTSTLNMYDDSVLNTALLTVVKYDSTKAYVNLYNNARINATTVVMNEYADSSLTTSNLTLNNNSKLYASNMLRSPEAVTPLWSSMTMRRYMYRARFIAQLMVIIRNCRHSSDIKAK